MIMENGIRVDYRMTLDCFLEGEILKRKRKQDLPTKSGKTFLNMVIAAIVIYIIAQVTLLFLVLSVKMNPISCLIADGVFTVVMVVGLFILSKRILVYQKRKIFRKRNLAQAPCYVILKSDSLVYSIDGANMTFSYNDVEFARESEKCFVILTNNNENICIPKYGLTEKKKIDFSAALSELLPAKFQNLC